MVQDVMDSIEPIEKSDKKPNVVGNVLAVDDNKNNTDLLKKRLTQLVDANDKFTKGSYQTTKKNIVPVSSNSKIKNIVSHPTSIL